VEVCGSSVVPLAEIRQGVLYSSHPVFNPTGVSHKFWYAQLASMKLMQISSACEELPISIFPTSISICQ
jgi:hypothetical protein